MSKELQEYLRKHGDFKDQKFIEKQIKLLFDKLNMISETPRGKGLFGSLEMEWDKENPLTSLKSFIERLSYYSPEKRWNTVRALVGLGQQKAFWSIYEELRVKSPSNIMKTSGTETVAPTATRTAAAPPEEKKKPAKKPAKISSKKKSEKE